MVNFLKVRPVPLVPPVTVFCPQHVSRVITSSEVCANTILASPKEGEVVIPSKFPSPSENPSGSPSENPSFNPSLSPTERPSKFPSQIPSEEPSTVECPKLSTSTVPSMVLIPILRVSPIFLPRFVPTYCPSNLPSEKGSKMSFGVPDPIGTKLVQQVSDEDPKSSFRGVPSA